MATLAQKSNVTAVSIILPALLLSALVAGLALQTGLIGGGGSSDAALLSPQTVVVEPRTYSYRSEGHFLKGGISIDGPLVTVSRTAPLEIMKYQVSAQEYDLCVADGACAAAEERQDKDGVPATGVNYDDARAYADWLSQKTGQVWRLPTDAQWAFAAGSRFADDALGTDADDRNPAIRWLADYERESARKATRNPAPQPLGTFGENEFGVADIGGNIWEWTDTCHRRVNVDADGRTISEAPACGIYVTEGKHRAPMSSFIRDPKTGGCSVGTPPDNLGFRLVRDSRWYAPVVRAFETGIGRRA